MIKQQPYSVIASKELRLCKTMLGKEFPSILTIINNLAGVLRDQDNYEEAQEMYLYYDYYRYRSTYSPLANALILGIEPEIYRSFCAVIRRWFFRKYN
jgi:hypothetical protein